MFHPLIETILFIDIIFGVFTLFALFKSIKIYFSWDILSTTKKQYQNEKNSFLVALIIKYLLLFKIPLFIFFIFTMDQLSINFIGAMCAAGVVDNLDYANALLILKILNLYFLGFWLIIHNVDLKDEQRKLTRLKFGYFIFVACFILFELIFDFITLTSIDTTQIVQCCSTIFSKTATSYIGYLFIIETKYYVGLFYTVFLFLLYFGCKKSTFIYAILNIVFLIISLITLVLFFGTYIYELPTHHCPFCFLQADYYYMGYLLYFLLFGGTFYGIATIMENLFHKSLTHYIYYSLFANTLYVSVLSFYVIRYFIANGVFL